MTREEKIALHELLGRYAEEIKPEIHDDPKSKTELAANLMICNHVKTIGEIREALCYDF